MAAVSRKETLGSPFFFFHFRGSPFWAASHVLTDAVKSSWRPHPCVALAVANALAVAQVGEFDLFIRGRGLVALCNVCRHQGCH